MDNHYVKFIGKIEFEIENKTKKHEAQSSWKRTAMILLPGDICEYYSWFINKRYNIILNKPLRGAHVTFINDSMRDLSLGYKTTEQIDETWGSVKNKWNGKRIEVILDVSPRTNAEYWWLNVPEEHRVQIHDIRAELGLKRPFFGLHLTLGYIPDKMEEVVIVEKGKDKGKEIRIPISDNIVRMEHSKYIHDLLKKGLIT